MSNIIELSKPSKILLNQIITTRTSSKKLQKNIKKITSTTASDNNSNSNSNENNNQST